MIFVWLEPYFFSPGVTISGDTPGLSPPIIIINTDQNTGLWLVQIDHVTRILASDWSAFSNSSGLQCVRDLNAQKNSSFLHFAYFGIYGSYLCRSSLCRLVAACFCIRHCNFQLHLKWEKTLNGKITQTYEHKTIFSIYIKMLWFLTS